MNMMNNTLIFDFSSYHVWCGKTGEPVGTWAYNCNGRLIMDGIVIDSHGCPHPVTATWCREVKDDMSIDQTES